MPRLWQTHRARRETTPAEAAALRDEMALRYRRVFSTPEGEQVLADLLARCGVMQSSLDSDPLLMAAKEGRRRVGLELIETINRDPDAHLRMLRSGQTEELTRE